MDELKKLVIENAGITEEQATASIETITKFIKDRVPHMVHSQLDKIIAGMTFEDSIKSQVGNLGGDVKERTEGLARDLKHAFENAFKSKKNEDQQ